MSRCPDCGAPTSAGSCEPLFHTLLALDYSARPPWGPVHSTCVACYRLQHPSQTPEADREFLLGVLRVFLAGGVADLHPALGRERRRNSHRSGGRRPRPEDLPEAGALVVRLTPTPYATTIADVAVEGTFPADGHAERVRRWAADTLAAWTAAPPGG